MNKNSIVYTNDNCIGCNKCIKVCSAIGACVSVEKNGKARIDVDGSKCVACGSCIDVCVHGAREFMDDTVRFFDDLSKGEPISLLLAPAFKANYPDEYESVLGGLKELGVNRIISVSFGADITTWGYLNYINEYNFVGGISQPCPAAVSYIERYLPELLPKVFPVQSPLMCAAIYARKELGITDKLAFISPCIAKKLEIEDPHNEGLVQYNVTFEHLMDYVRLHKISGRSMHSEIEYGLGSFYPTPGGLAENVKWFLGDSVFIRQIEGEKHLYEWMHINKDRIKDEKTPFLFIDALNCEKGCICGTAVNPEKSKTDDALYALLDIRERSKKETGNDAWSRPDTPEERLKNFNEQFKDLKLEDYLRGYTDRSRECRYELPNDEQLEAIFESMNKTTEESRNIDCTCCGYESCKQMATAIFNGFNHKENCIYYEKTMVRELEMEKVISEKTAKAKTDFFANISHEIRTPINAIIGMNEMILRETSDDGIAMYSESIQNAGKALLDLVNDILDFSDVDAQTADITSVTYDLSTYRRAQREREAYKETFIAPDAEVLVIDDTLMNLMVFKSLLKHTKIKIDTASSGDEGLTQAAKKKYDIIFFDHMMPGKDGIETLHELRESSNNPNRSTTAVCLTANAIPGAEEQYLRVGFDAYMSKPVDPKKLEELILKYLPSGKVQITKSDAVSEEKIDIPDNLAPLSESGVINVTTGIRNSGNADSYMSMLKIYYDSIDEKSDEIERFYSEGDIENYTIKVHALKSSSRIIGATAFGEKAQKMEDAGKKSDTRYIDENHDALMVEFKDFKSLIGVLFADDEDDSGKPEADDGLLDEAFSEMRLAAEDFDSDKFDEIFDRLSQYAIPKDKKEMIARLRSLADNFDFEGVTKILDEQI